MYRLKAGALQLTLFICVVIALLLAGFVILIHTHKRFNLQSNMLIESIKEADNGITYAFGKDLPLSQSIVIGSDSEDYKNLKIQKDYWGLFQKVISTSTIKNKTFIKIGLIGSVQPKTERTALYLADNNKPLVLVGNTRIQGVTYLAKRGVKPGNIAGQSYYGDRLIYGSIKNANNLPGLLPETLQQIKSLQRRFNPANSQNIIDLNSDREHQNSFKDPTKYILSSSDIRLSQVSLIGHIIVQSSTKIIVDATSNLQEVILVAPKIEITDNATGVFQAIATKEILVGRNCMLNYPSTLIVNETGSISNNTQTQSKINTISIDKNSIVNGMVMFLGQPKRNNTKTQVIINEDATIRGEVYCNQNLELKGTVYGSIFTANFLANQKGSIYQNHIYNGTINISKLPEEYVGLAFANQKKGVVKWLY